VVWGLLLAALFVPFRPVLERWARVAPLGAQLYADAAGLTGTLAATWILTRVVDRRPFASIGLVSRRAPREIAVGLAIGVAWLGLSVAFAWACGWAKPLPAPAMSGPLLAGAALSVLLNVLTQQLVLCGYIFHTLRSRAGRAAAIVLSAALFSSFHAGAFHGAWLPPVNVFGAGALFCLAYSVAGSLWLSTSMHFAWNYLLGPVLGLTVSGLERLGLGWHWFKIAGPPLATGGAFGLEGSLIVTATTAAGVVGMWLALWRIRKREAGLQADQQEYARRA
jgi:membrane protease YdiL (CAAX protease family)